jgi:polyhydroxyalkanoate synthase subunit PhaC
MSRRQLRLPPSLGAASSFNQPLHDVLYPLDIPLKASIGRITHGVSPAALTAAFHDWAGHLVASPGKQLSLLVSAQRAWLTYGLELAELLQGLGASGIASDKRFAHPDWQQPAFAAMAGAFLRTQQWWHEATTGVPGVSPHHEQAVEFVARQMLDVLSPSNGVLSNPEVLQRTVASGGRNLADGALNFWREAQLVMAGQPPPGAEHFRPGKEVAASPGQVVYHNHLIELIQYEPATARVRPEPVLIVPSWIMKYYILDLSARNSLVRFLVGQGHTVFMVSWRNPTAEDRDIGMDDYLEQGVMQALRAVQRAQPHRQVHLAGYCLGGTLVAMAAALLAREEEAVLKTLTLLAAQTDFEEPGEIGLFIDDSQVSFLEEIMAEQGYLDGRQMAGAFALINSRDLVWSRLVREYLLGRRTALDDLHAWNADATRLPARMHSEYLRGMYLRNDLAEGRFMARGRPLCLQDIRVPTFVVGTERDHVSPWRSVYKVHSLLACQITFVLTTGGHNVGIVNPPVGDAAGVAISHRVAEHGPGAPHLPPEAWYEHAAVHAGSWWPTWHAWLAAQGGVPVRPLPLGGSGTGRLEPLYPAPGRYVLQT